MLNPAWITTILTFSTFMLGIFVPACPQLSTLALTLGLTVVIVCITPRYNHLLKLQLFQCLLTTYIFGIVGSYVYWNWGKYVQFDAFGLFLVISTFRYYGQFQLINCFHHHQLEWQSFLIYHSKMYMITNVFLILEHIFTRYILHLQYKEYHILMLPALIVSILALVLRILSFFTAKHNFTHKVSYSKKPNHKLVTNGIYSIFRHPSYTGFFYFTVSTMILIGNFLSALLFGLMLSVFFYDRIQSEEYYLLKFFGDQYYRYKIKTGVWIPFLPKKIMEKLPDIGG